MHSSSCVSVAAAAVRCNIHHQINYLQLADIIQQQRRVVYEQIKLISQSHIVHPGLTHWGHYWDGNKAGGGGEEVSAAPATIPPLSPLDVPGVKETGYVPSLLPAANTSTASASGVPSELSAKLHLVLKHIKQQKDAWPFAVPVDAKLVPDYYVHIAHPMDLQTMQAKLDRFEYRDKEAFHADFKTMVANCLSAGTLVNLADGRALPIELVESGDEVLSYRAGIGREEEGLTARRVLDVLDQGRRLCVELLFSDTRTLVCTLDHRIRTADGRWVEAGQLLIDADDVVVGVGLPHTAVGGGSKRIGVVDRCMHRPPRVPLISHVRLVGRQEVGVRRVYDLSVPSPQGDVSRSFMAGGICVHNCKSYNTPETTYYRCAETLDKTFDRKWDQVHRKG